MAKNARILIVEDEAREPQRLADLLSAWVAGKPNIQPDASGGSNLALGKRYTKGYPTRATKAL